jgi:dihydroflavonol-4-reductase
MSAALCVLVMGATGFIGGAIAREALAEGWQVRAMRRDEKRTGAIGDLSSHHRFSWHLADLEDPSSLRRVMDGCDVVFHAAAHYPISSRDKRGQIDKARRQTDHIVETFRRVGAERLVYTSSLSTIGRPPAGEDRLADEHDVYRLGDAPICYFDVKIVMEDKFLSSGLPVVALCPTAVFGPGDVKPTSGLLLINVARGLMPVYVEGQHNVVDVRDVARSHVNAVNLGRIGERYILGGENLSFRSLLEVSAAEANRRPPWLPVSPAVVRSLGALAGQLGILGGDILEAIEYWQPLDSSKAQRELGHTYRPFAETVRDSLQWFREHNYL